jgi:hypothetical protein
MKNISLFVVALALGTASCNNAADKIKAEDERMDLTQTVSTEEVAEIVFTEEMHDFGDITEGETPEHIFTFKNTSKVPLVITSATGSCGCTVPDWPRNPIAPGATGEIKVSFNSASRSGRQDKQVTVEANTMPRTTVIKITSNVLPKTES